MKLLKEKHFLFCEEENCHIFFFMKEKKKSDAHLCSQVCRADGGGGDDGEGLSIYSVLVCCRGVIALKRPGLKLLFYKY